MADQTKIEWTDATWQPVTGCSVVSPGCTNCYAMKLAGTRLRHHPSRQGLTIESNAGPVWNGKVRLNEQWLDQPLRWKSPRRIFVCAHGDLFHDSVPDEWIDRVFAIMALAPQHTFQVLTKRSARMRAYVSRFDWDKVLSPEAAAFKGDIERTNVTIWPLPNVWLGVSTERQQEADERIPDLLATPAAVRFISAEPLLGPINLRRIRVAPDHHTMIDALDGYAITDSSSWSGTGHERAALDWVIVGGESGAGARPMHPDWEKQIREQCEAAGVAYFRKQWGEWKVVYDRDRDDPDWQRCDVVVRETPNGQWLNLAGGQGFHGERVVRVNRVGKKAAGRLLHGVEHNGMPQAREAARA